MSKNADPKAEKAPEPKKRTSRRRRVDEEKKRRSIWADIKKLEMKKPSKKLTAVVALVLLFLAGILILVYLLIRMDAFEPAPDTFQTRVGFPEDSEIISDEMHTFRASVSGLDLEEYRMFWKVDEGVWNIMHNNHREFYKEADASVETWNWNNDGPYSIYFIAMDKDDNILIISEPVQIFVER